MAINIKYSTAEKASFKVQPETCPVLEKACFDAQRFDYSAFTTKLKTKGVELTKDKENILLDVVSSLLFEKTEAVLKVALYKGTFPLRASLVEVIEKQMIAKGEILEPEFNHFRDWIADREKMDKLNERINHG